MAETAGAAPVCAPSETFARMVRAWLADGLNAEHLAEDVVIEEPFAAGGPRRIQGRAEFMAFAAAGRAALPVRLDEVRNVVVHQSTDPEVIIAEYELVGTVTTTNTRASVAFIGVLRARDGKAVLWREYQNSLAIAQALGLA